MEKRLYRMALPSNSRINKVNKILQKKYNTKNFNTLSKGQLEYGSRLLNIPFKELQEIYGNNAK